MGEFDEILEETLEGINDPFENAVQELESVINDVTASIRNAVGDENVHLRLKPEEEQSDETLFSLEFKLGRYKGGGTSIGYYRVTLDGYPIQYGTIDVDDTFRASGQLADRAAIVEHFKEMLANRNSPLVLQIAYAKRRGIG